MPFAKTDAEWRVALGRNPDRLSPETEGKPCDRCGFRLRRRGASCCSPAALQKSHKSSHFRKRDDPEAQSFWLCQRCAEKVDLFW
jgi:hypothetical protein